jgi:hypothetical protein
MPSPTRRSPRPRSPRLLALLGLLVLALVLAACGAASGALHNAGDETKGGVTAPGAQPPDAKDVGGVPVPGTATGGGDGSQVASLADQKIIKTGEITVEVPGVPAAVGRVRAMAVALGGYVGGSQSGTKDDAATLTLRIPAARFDEALSRLHQLDGDVVAEATREDDATSQIVDIEARLQNLQASEAQYRTLLAKAEKVADILAVQQQLDNVRGQIEELQAQDKQLNELTDLSTLTVTLAPSALQHAAGSWDPGKTVADAFAALVEFAQSIGNGSIWFAIVWLPALVVLGIVLLLVWRLTPRLRARMARRPQS